MTFFEGAVSYNDIKTMPLEELFWLKDQASAISSDREREMEKSKRRGK